MAVTVCSIKDLAKSIGIPPTTCFEITPITILRNQCEPIQSPAIERDNQHIIDSHSDANQHSVPSLKRDTPEESNIDPYINCEQRLGPTVSHSHSQWRSRYWYGSHSSCTHLYTTEFAKIDWFPLPLSVKIPILIWKPQLLHIPIYYKMNWHGRQPVFDKPTRWQTQIHTDQGHISTIWPLSLPAKKYCDKTKTDGS